MKATMNYKKPVFWVILLLVLICGTAGVYFLTSPKTDGKDAVPPATSDEQMEEPDNSRNDTVLPEVGETEDGGEVSPLLSINGEQIGTVTVYKDEVGRVARKIETWISGIVKETSYTYYPDGNIKEVIIDNGDALIKTKYREDGTLEISREEHAKGTLETTYTETGSRSGILTEYLDGSWEEQTYDSEYNMLSWVQVDKNQFRWSREYTYYENGNRKSEIEINEAWGTYTEHFYYEDGTSHSVTLFGESKEHPEVISSQVRMENFYDAEGNQTTKNEYRDGRIEEVRFDAKGTRVWSKVIKPDGSTEERYYTDGKLSRHIINGEEMPIAGS